MLINVIKRAVVSQIQEPTDNLTPQLQLSTLAAGSQDVVQSHVSGQQPALQMLISSITIIQLQNYFGEAVTRNINS